MPNRIERRGLKWAAVIVTAIPPEEAVVQRHHPSLAPRIGSTLRSSYCVIVVDRRAAHCSTLLIANRPGQRIYAEGSMMLSRPPSARLLAGVEGIWHHESPDT